MTSRLVQYIRLIKSLPGRFSRFEEKSDDLAQQLQMMRSQIQELLSKVQDIQQPVHGILSGVHDVRVTLEKLPSNHEIARVRKAVNQVARNAVRSDKINVLFLVHNTSSWESLDPIYRAMDLDDRFKPLIASIDCSLGGGQEYSGEDLVHQWLSEAGMPHIRLGMKSADEILTIVRAISPEVIFRQSHWDHDLPPAFSSSELSFSKLAYVSYEMMTLVQNQLLAPGNDLVMDDGFHRSAWRVFCANDHEKRLYERNSARGGTNVCVTGHPKTESLIAEKLDRNKQANRKTVIWSPHHSIGTGWFDFGMFDLVAEDMLEWLSDCPDVDIVFSPHPSLKRASDERFRPGYFDDFLRRWSSMPNGKIREGGAYGRLFDESDALITDGISWLLEYQLFDKPTIFLERPDHLPFNDIGEVACRSLIRTPSVAGSRAYLDQYFETGVDTMRDERAGVVKALVPHLDPTRRIIQSIVEDLRPQSATQQLHLA